MIIPSRRRSLSNRSHLVISAVVVLFGTLVGYGPMADPKPLEIPPLPIVLPEDDAYGREVLHLLSRSYRRESNPAMEKRVLEILSRLSKGLGSATGPWNLILLHDPAFRTALVTRGNYIFVWSGLVSGLPNDSDLASILAHEIAHYLAGHPQGRPEEELRALTEGSLTSTARHLMIRQNSGRPISGLTDYAVRQGIRALIGEPGTSEYEDQADQIALALLSQGGFDLESVYEFWKKGSSLPKGRIQYFTRHRISEERLENIKELLQEVKKQFPPLNDASGGFSFGTALPSTSSSLTPAPAYPDQNPSQPGAPSGSYLSSSSVSVFSAPTIASDVIDQLAPESVIIPVEENGDWIKIATPIEGYVRRVGLTPIP